MLYNTTGGATLSSTTDNITIEQVTSPPTPDMQSEIIYNDNQYVYS